MLKQVLQVANRNRHQTLKLGQRGFSSFQTEMENFDFTDNYDFKAMGLKEPNNLQKMNLCATI